MGRAIVFVLICCVLVPIDGIAQTAVGPISITTAKIIAGNITPGDAPGYPATLSTPGSYILNSNLAPTSGNQAIVVTADDVVIDLNGFTIDGGNTCTAGTGTAPQGNSCVGGTPASFALVDASSVHRVTLKNGSVKGSKGDGVHIADGGKIRDLVVTNNVGNGLVQYGNADLFGVTGLDLLSSEFSFNGRAGVSGSHQPATLVGVTANYNQTGIADVQGLIRDTNVGSNSVAGLNVGYAILDHVYAKGNATYGIFGGSIIRDSVAFQNSASGFTSFPTSGAVYVNDSAVNNTGIGFDFSAGSACYSQISSSSNSGAQISGGIALTGTHVTCP